MIPSGFESHMGVSVMSVGQMVGYCRVSTVGDNQQAGYEAQQRDLEKIGCSEIFKEKVSSVAKREQLHAALSLLPEGRHAHRNQAG